MIKLCESPCTYIIHETKRLLRKGINLTSRDFNIQKFFEACQVTLQD